MDFEFVNIDSEQFQKPVEDARDIEMAVDPLALDALWMPKQELKEEELNLEEDILDGEEEEEDDGGGGGVPGSCNSLHRTDSTALNENNPVEDTVAYTLVDPVAFGSPRVVPKLELKEEQLIFEEGVLYGEEEEDDGGGVSVSCSSLQQTHPTAANEKMSSRASNLILNKKDNDILTTLKNSKHESTKETSRKEQNIVFTDYKNVLERESEEKPAPTSSFNKRKPFVVRPGCLVNYSCSEESSDEDNETIPGVNFTIYENTDYQQPVVPKHCEKSESDVSGSDFSDISEHSYSDCSEPEHVENESELMSTKKVTVQCNNNTKYTRVWDKKAACLFCGKLLISLRRHLAKIHSEEREVGEFLSKKKGSKERKLLLTGLRKKGNFVHNKSVLDKKEGQLLICHRPQSRSNPEEFLPCEYCLGFYKKTELANHVKLCTLAKSKEKRKMSVLSGTFLFSSPDVNSEKLRKIVRNMINDRISLVTQNDELIMKYGSVLCDKRDGKAYLALYISQRLRELARFVIISRKYNKNMTLRKLIDPASFEIVIKSAREIGGLENTGRFSNRPSLALKIGYALKNICRIVKGESIIKNDEESKKKVEDFLELYDLEWSRKVLQQDTKKLGREKCNKPSSLPVIPVIDDVKKFYKLREKVQRRNSVDDDAVFSSQSDSDIEIKKQKRKSNCKIRQVRLRVAWDASQTSAVENFFKREILRKTVPGKSKCVQCIEENKCLVSKSWKLVKYKVHNIIQKNKRSAKND